MAYYHEEFYNKGIKYEILRKVVPMDLNNNFELLKDSNYIYEFNTLNENIPLIDFEIADAISILNQKGYKTLNCCEGHLDIPSSIEGIDDLNKMEDHFIISDPYVSFDLSSYKNYRLIGYFLDNIPNLFHVLYDIDYVKLEKSENYKEEEKFEFLKKKNPRLFNIYCRIDGNDPKSFYKYKREAINELICFADSLEDARTYK